MTDYTISIDDIDRGTTYYYRTYVKLLDEVYYDSNVMSVTTLGAKCAYVNGHKFIDLGLPSGLLWAQRNVGASSAYADGDYYAWGETETKSVYSYSWDYYKWYDGTNLTKYNWRDNKIILDASDDVAAVKWGKGCRMPLQTEFQELYDKCNWTWKSNYHGTSGYLVKGPNGNSIFLPASGYFNRFGHQGSSEGSYWSATYDSRSNAHILDFSSDYVFPASMNERDLGLTVRPVAER